MQIDLDGRANVWQKCDWICARIPWDGVVHLVVVLHAVVVTVTVFRVGKDLKLLPRYSQ